jgi:hypothetical protein
MTSLRRRRQEVIINGSSRSTDQRNTHSPNPRWSSYSPNPCDGAFSMLLEQSIHELGWWLQMEVMVRAPRPRCGRAAWRPRGAYSFRRAWPAPPRRGTRPSAAGTPRPPRPTPRGTGRAARLHTSRQYHACPSPRPPHIRGPSSTRTHGHWHIYRHTRASVHTHAHRVSAQGRTVGQ